MYFALLIKNYGVADFWDENNFAYIQNPGMNVKERLYSQKTSRTYATPKLGLAKILYLNFAAGKTQVFFSPFILQELVLFVL
ncbi:MAG TPA: hypothetical protein VK203_09960 [Nostocaceae cyanobacterium]|nr:hypothetical protein [Nostocaceae cyanobacterium]